MADTKAVVAQLPRELSHNLLIEAYQNNGWDMQDLSRDLTVFIRDVPDRTLLQQAWVMELHWMVEEFAYEPIRFFQDVFALLNWFEIHGYSRPQPGWQLWEVMISETLLGVFVYVPVGTRAQHRPWLERMRYSFPGSNTGYILSRYEEQFRPGYDGLPAERDLEGNC